MISADTGFWVALLDSSDNLHLKVRDYATSLDEPLITTLPVVTEVCYLLQTRWREIFGRVSISARRWIVSTFYDR